ncbi:1379_t:CDS:2, partial [Cetraspora pellucida]
LLIFNILNLAADDLVGILKDFEDLIIYDTMKEVVKDFKGLIV